MHYVYVLYAQADNQLYVDCINGLNKRLHDRNLERVPVTKDRTPLLMVHYEAFKNKYDAFFCEKWLKTGWGRKYLSQSLHNSMKSLGG